MVLGVYIHIVPHLKALNNGYQTFSGLGPASTFTLCHALLKKALLLHTEANV